jgi:hypothetical protein
MLKLHKVKLACKRTIVHLTLLVLLLSGMMVPTHITAPISIQKVEAQSGCSPEGFYSIGGHNYYRWLANSEPANSLCWNAVQGRVAVVQTNTCGWTENTWEFYYGGSISQTFTVPPNDFSAPRFNIQYTLDFIDPNNDPAWNRFEMRVLDLTTGATLAYDFFDGSMGDLSCSARNFTWNQDLSNHTIQVRIKGTRGYNNTLIRVRDIYLYQRLDPV